MDNDLTNIVETRFNNQTETFKESMFEDYEDYETAAKEILETLKKEFQPHKFGTYLKRYIYKNRKDLLPEKKRKVENPFEDIGDKDYKEALLTAFKNTDTESFGRTPYKQQVKNWLSQRTVDRESAFAIAYALNISVDVFEREFLKKALLQAGYNYKDPYEVILWYCLKQDCEKGDCAQSRYRHAKSLKEQYKKMSKQDETNKPHGDEPNLENTVVYAPVFNDCSSDKELLNKIVENQLMLNQTRLTAYKRFEESLKKLKTVMCEQELEVRYENIIDIGDEIAETSNEDELERLKMRKRDALERLRTINSDNISNAFVEDKLYTPIAFKKNNLMGLKEDFKFIYSNPDSRLSRGRILNILNKETNVTRSDLLNVAFLSYSYRTDFESDSQRWNVFVDEVNSELIECGFEPLRKTNPHDYIMAACMKTAYPLTVYQLIHFFCIGLTKEDLKEYLDEDQPAWDDITSEECLLEDKKDRTNR